MSKKIVLSVLVLASCGRSEPPAAPTLGHFSDTLRARARALCGSDFGDDALPAALTREARARLRGRHVVAAGCIVPDKHVAIEIDYDADTREVFAVAGHGGATNEVFEWFRALEEAGMSGSVGPRIEDSLSASQTTLKDVDLHADGIGVRATLADDGRQEFLFALER